MKTVNEIIKYYKILMLIFIGIIPAGCNRDRNNPGWDYFPDMFYSTAYETFTSNPNFRDSMTMRVPEPGTVPRDFNPFGYTIDAESRTRAGIELINPLKPTGEVISRGKEVYSTFCVGCHGNSGQGNGYLYSSGLYPVRPRALSGDNANELKDGEIYHTITLGFGSMGSHASQIRPDDRWAIIVYIRRLQAETKEGQANKGR
jgi:mono/diheme cytochrome c family protein